MAFHMAARIGDNRVMATPYLPARLPNPENAAWIN